MPPWTLLLLAVPVVGIHAEDAQGVSWVEAHDLSSGLASALERLTRWRTSVQSEPSEVCADADRCAERVRGELGADEIVFVKAFGTSTRIRFVAERVDGGGSLVSSVQADFARSYENWPMQLEGMARILFPDAVVPLLPTAATASPTPQSDLTWPWASIGAGVAASGFAAWLRVNSNDLRETLATEGVQDPESVKLSSNVQGLASNVLFGVGAAAVTMGIWMLVSP